MEHTILNNFSIKLDRLHFHFKNYGFLLFLSLLLSNYGCQTKTSSTDVINLLCEYLPTPLGIDTQQPRLKWELKTPRNGALQKGYKLSIGTDSIRVAKGEGDIWHIENKNSSSNKITYKGNPLKPFTKYFWSIQIIDENDNKSNIAVSSFETGMMDQKNWKGSWITDSHNKDFKPAPYFRKLINIQKKIKKARAYITAAGLYELYINGDKMGNHILDPMYTRFDKRNLYVSYDVTQYLKQDKNVFGVLLGNGWYNHQSTAVWNFDKAEWRSRPRFLMNTHITYDDGETDIITTDESWKTSLGSLIFNSIYTAEHYDATQEQVGWNTLAFDDNTWENVQTVPAPSKNIVSQTMHPITNSEEIIPKSIKKIASYQYLFDLGRNISGVTKLKIQGSKGTVVKVIHAEQLDSLGQIDLSNINVHYRPTDDSDPFQTDIYILNGKENEVLMPKFNYKGFQYVEVISNKPINLTKESLRGIFMHSNVPPVGTIHSSNETINKIWAATNASYLSNLFGYPTDCPQREKNGWTGDAHIAIETGLYNFDGITIYEKWLADHRDEQQENGVLPSIIPTWGGWGYDWGNGPDWTSTIAIIPWELYQFYGDDRALRVNYANIKKYVDHISSISTDGLTDWGLGDWVPVQDVTPKEFTSSIYYFVDVSILAKTARLLNKQDDFAAYSALANKIKEAINQKYLNKETAIYGNGFQTELSAPLYWGIVPVNLKQKVADNLAKQVKKDNKHLNVGLLGTKTILNALSENGYAELAFEMASQETYPSWGWWIVNGATTLYENWPINAKSDISRNHIMFGEIGAWLFKGIGGIFPDPEAPGFKNIILKPHFVNGLDYFDASHTGPFGEIISNWKRDDGTINYHVVIPPNSTSTLFLEAKEVGLNNKMVEKQDDNHYKIYLDSGTYNINITPSNH